MRVYTFSEARQHLASVLELAQQEGCVQITRRDGGVFNIQPAAKSRSPLDVEGVSTGVTKADILAAVRESRERGYNG
ncbi:MAG: type II toxin-antitoxin system Phd/YefM family antitoxin [Gammaproteobacteria bacterium]|nr:type II toxin-antitoxin system Phd/YefM family antitoxin [Gammaproteobacteria bacterium]